MVEVVPASVAQTIAKAAAPGPALCLPVKRRKPFWGLVAEFLTAWPGFLEVASDSTRHAVVKFADQIPKTLQTDAREFVELDRRIENLVDQLAVGATESPALRRRLDQYEQDLELLRVRIEEGRRAKEMALVMPDDDWIRGQMAELTMLLADNPDRTSRLLRRLFGKVKAEAVVAPGKVRGFTRLHLRIEPSSVLKEVLKETLPESLFAFAGSGTSGSPLEYQLDLVKPTRFDSLAPEIVALRSQGIGWKKIGRLTGVGTGNVHNIWQRWRNSRTSDGSGRA
jgi:hypothetical protein